MVWAIFGETAMWVCSMDHVNRYVVESPTQYYVIVGIQYPTYSQVVEAHILRDTCIGRYIISGKGPQIHTAYMYSSTNRPSYRPIIHHHHHHHHHSISTVSTRTCTAYARHIKSWQTWSSTPPHERTGSSKNHTSLRRNDLLVSDTQRIQVYDQSPAIYLSVDHNYPIYCVHRDKYIRCGV